MDFTAGFDARVQAVDGTEHLALRGELDLATVGVLEEALGRSGRDHVIVEAVDLTFIDVVGVVALVRCHQSLAARGGGLVVRHAPRMLLQVRELLGLEEALPVEAS